MAPVVNREIAALYGCPLVCGYIEDTRQGQFVAYDVTGPALL
jgi:hypothetical protein